MRQPKCKLYSPAARYPRKVVRSIHFDGDKLVVEIQGDGGASGRVTFQSPVWFRVLDERDLCEFWNTYSEPHGWLWEVEEGGWLELESQRQHFSSRDVIPGLREFLIVDDPCISVLTVESPEIQDVGAGQLEPLKMVERVNSKESFLEFVAALRSDWNARSRESDWENADLGRFLEAMQAWTEDMDERVPAAPNWRTFADMLYAGKIYE